MEFQNEQPDEDAFEEVNVYSVFNDFICPPCWAPEKMQKMGEVRKLIEDPSFPNGWPNKETHIDHQVKWKQGTSKEYGVHGSAVGVDFDICIADGICITVCPVNVFDRMELEGEQQKMDNGVTNDSGKAPLATWKADPAREKDCIFCRACEIQCPVQAIKITEP